MHVATLLPFLIKLNLCEEIRVTGISSDQTSPPILQFSWIAILVATDISICFLLRVLDSTHWLGTATDTHSAHIIPLQLQSLVFISYAPTGHDGFHFTPICRLWYRSEALPIIPPSVSRQRGHTERQWLINHTERQWLIKVVQSTWHKNRDIHASQLLNTLLKKPTSTQQKQDIHQYIICQIT